VIVGLILAGTFLPFPIPFFLSLCSMFILYPLATIALFTIALVKSLDERSLPRSSKQIFQIVVIWTCYLLATLIGGELLINWRANAWFAQNGPIV
jgi:hypothetical protein